ncbi:hypothetical protein CCUS01_07026 [Colletotrichum cuscutae]|uniref:Uncharacterized protein n=1 Tax=Colletotrichum cuscutae TaxID=1209917 RepID=A0AAI9UZJ9_9PEZI|nr:hypothetical protein CCUS01_07026 [Colletotrichum cuscutae]
MFYSAGLITSILPLIAARVIEDASLAGRTTYPFNNLIAYGDELSDNGNGSFAHGITGDPANAGATDMIGQVANYTGRGAPGIRSSLQFLWFGENDLSMHTDAFWLGDPKNAQFAIDAAVKITAQVQNLIDKGAPYVMVANIYPKHLAPVTPKYLRGTNADCVKTWGQLHDSGIGQPQGIWLPKPLNLFCDGDETAQWTDCMIDGHANEYFWMNFIQPTTAGHKLIAQDMKKTIDTHFA